MPPLDGELEQFIGVNPGLHMSEIHRRFGGSWGNLNRALARLVAAGRVSAIPLSNRRHWFPCHLEKGRELLAKATFSPCQQVLGAMGGCKQATFAELLAATGLGRRRLRTALVMLVEGGVMVEEPARRPRYKLAKASAPAVLGLTPRLVQAGRAPPELLAPQP